MSKNFLQIFFVPQCYNIQYSKLLTSYYLEVAATFGQKKVVTAKRQKTREKSWLSVVYILCMFTRSRRTW